MKSMDLWITGHYHPQVGMLNKRKRVRKLNLLPTPPKIVAELLQDLERTRCDEHLQSLSYEPECMYKAALLRAEKKEIRLMQMLDEERKRGREEVRAFESRERCYMEASAWFYRQKQQLKQLIHRLQKQNADFTRDYTQTRGRANLCVPGPLPRPGCPTQAREPAVHCRYNSRSVRCRSREHTVLGRSADWSVTGHGWPNLHW